jgi:hypothetical protein
MNTIKSPIGKRSLTGGTDLGKDSGTHAKRLAAAILEVLAGVRTPAEAATALEMSVPRYYQVEAQALRGLLAACEPKPIGRVRSTDSELAALRQQTQRLEREITRQQALLRAAQRAVGLAPPAAAPLAKNGKKTRKRRVARALNVATRLQAETHPPTGTPITPVSSTAV